MADLPIVCTLDSGTLNARREQLLPGLIAAADSREVLTDGLRLRFPNPDILPGCCRWWTRSASAAVSYASR